MPKILRNLKFSSREFLSLVDQGAGGDGKNNRPRIVLTKRKGDMIVTIKQRIANIMKNLRKAEGDMPNPAQDDTGKTPQQMLEEALVGLPDDKVQQILEAVALMVGEQTPPDDVAQSKGKDDPQPQPPPEPTPDPEDKSKSKNADVEKAKAELKKANDRIAALEDDVRKRKAIEKAKETPFVPGSEEDIAALLSDAGALPEKSRNALSKILQSTNEALRKSSLFAEYGNGRSGGAAGSAESKLEGMAKARQREMAKGNKKTTYEQAYDDVMNENPELYAQFCKDQESGVA